MVLFAAVAVLGTLSVLFVLFTKWRYQYWTRRGVLQWNPEFLYGNMKPVVKGISSGQDAFMNLYKIAKAKGVKIIGIYNFLIPQCIIMDVKLVKNIFLKDFSYFPSHGIGYGTYHHENEPITEHLFNLDGEKWKQLRTKMTPTFTTGKMKMMFETLLEKADILNKVVNQHAEAGKELHIKETLARFGTDVIATVALGIECNSLEEEDNRFRSIGRTFFEPDFKKFLFEEMLPISLLNKFGYRSVPAKVEAYFTEVVTESIKYRENSNVQRKDFMQLLLQLKHQGGVGHFTNQEIVTEAFIFYIAGFETSSSATTFAFLELAKHEDIQEKLRQEIHDVLEKHDGKLSYDALMEMDYLDKVLHESMRMYPPVTFIPRECAKSYKVPDSDIVIEKGIRVYIPSWGIHMDPEYYPNPEVFNPENFSPEAKAKRPDFTWLPFGEGPRMCIGLRFGMMQSKLAIVTLLKDFRVTLHEKTQRNPPMDKFSVVLSVEGDVWLKVQKL